MVTAPTPLLRHILGLDLGQQSDYTALALLESPWQVKQEYYCRTLKRWPLGTPYPEIIAGLARFCRLPVLSQALLVIDQTGVGRPVVEMVQRGLIQARVPERGGLVGVTITSGHEVHHAGSGRWNVPKKLLVSTLQVLLQSRRLHVSPTLPEALLLARELQTFKVKITPAGNETFESWREHDHDDLVLAVALAGWAAENLRWPARSNS